MFDAGEIRNLRQEATLNSIDFSRAKIRDVKGGGYVVIFNPPLVELGAVLLDPPTEVNARTAAIAEGEMLVGLMKIQRAERLKVRTGRVFGWSQDQINRRPLTEEEIAEYKSVISHKKEVARLTRELADVVEQNAVAAKANAGASDLRDMYGLAPNKPAKKPEAKAVPLPSANPKRAPSRGAKA